MKYLEVKILSIDTYQVPTSPQLYPFLYNISQRDTYKRSFHANWTTTPQIIILIPSIAK